MKLSIQNRLTLGTLFLYALMLFSVVLGLFYLVRVDDGSKAVLADNYESVRHLHGMHTELDGVEAQKSMAIIGIDSLLSSQEANLTEPGEQAATAELRRHFEDWKADTSVAFISAQAMRGDIDHLLRLNLDAIARKSELAEDNARHALFWLFLSAILILMVGLGFSVAFPSVMSAPIVRLKEAAKQLSVHNYRHRIPPFRMKELDELATAFNEMASELEAYDNSNLARLMAEKNRAEAVINSLRDPSIGVAPDGHVLFANRPALDLLGMHEADIVGQRATDVVQRNAVLAQVLQGTQGRPIRANVMGEEQFFLASSLPVESDKGPLGTLYVLQNITVFHERDRAKTDFLATISHELKTPLASSDIGLTLLERAGAEPLSTEQHAIVADLRKDQKRLTRIVGELLDLAQAETGHIRLNMSEPGVPAIVADAMDAVKSAAQQKGIRFDTRIHLDDARVRADADKAVWVLVNLLSNAVRHSPDDGVISINAQHTNDHVAITVSDQGSGIPMEEQDRVFQRFSPGRRTSQGSGLGLSIAREFMQAMGGSIALDRTYTTGASFTLHFLPAR
jgi:signal transduction histidine kinase